VAFWSVTFLMFAFGFLRRNKVEPAGHSKAGLLDKDD
jgi:hypothetical protein